MKSACSFVACIGLVLILASCRTVGAESGAVPKLNPPSSESQIIAVLKQAKRVLWLGAHPDDETSSSALLARVKDLSGVLYMVSLTSGENSDILWGSLRRGSEIGAARAKLFAQSAAVLRADGFEVGPFVNGPLLRGEIDFLSADAPHKDWPPKATSADVIAKWKKEGEPLGYVVATLRKLKPDVVVSMDSRCGVSGHDEHLAAGKLLLQAIPLAADATAYSGAGEPWKVRHLIFNASVIPQLVACKYCKCEGEDLPEPIEEVSGLESSPNYGMTYFGVACLVSRTYENAMKARGWSEQEIRTGCQQADQAALRAYQRGQTSPHFTQLFRVRPQP